MKISLNWLKDYVALDASVEELTRAITFLGFEVEQVFRTGAPKLEQVVVGEVLTRDKHPNADRLSVCTVDIGPAGGVKTIVCGAQNYQAGDRVPVALPGAVLPGNFAIKQSKIRGQLSDGMLCSAKELGLPEDPAGLLILADRPPLGAPINDVLPPGDVVFDIEITPNRPDCLSHLGIARELAAWFGKVLNYPAIKFRGVEALPSSAALAKEDRPDLLAGVHVESDEDCPLYTAHLVTGVKIGPSPAWLQQRLQAAGLRPVNNVVDIGNYVMIESGQPLHAFDAKKIAGRRLTVRRAADGEKIVTLDGRERALSSRMLVIADAEKPLVIAGVMGGENSGVDAATTDLVLEAAYFRPQSIRWTSRNLGLSSDSSYRFERGVDPHTLEEAAHRAIDLLVEIAGGQPAGPVHQAGADRVWQSEITITPGFVRRKAGFDLTDDFMKQALESLELKITREEQPLDGDPRWTVSIPSWRGDLDRPIDLVEEILRLHGTDRIPPAVVRAPGLIGDDDPAVVFNRQASGYLVGQHFHECMNYTLRAGGELKAWVSNVSADELALANPFTEDQSHLRSTLLIGLLENLRLNQARGTGAARLFETGRVFMESNGQVHECAAVAFLLSEAGPQRSWLARAPADFYTAKNHVAILAAQAGVDLAAAPIEPLTGPFIGWQEGHSAAIGGIPEPGWQARFGLLNPALVRNLGIEGKAWGGIFAILPEKLAAGTKHRRYQPFSLFPVALRDLALAVDQAVPAEEVRHTLAQAAARAATAGRFELESVGIFDVYRGKELPEGKKSLAFSLVFRAADRTLTDDEVNLAFQKLQEEITGNTPWQIRK